MAVGMETIDQVLLTRGQDLDSVLFPVRILRVPVAGEEDLCLPERLVCPVHQETLGRLSYADRSWTKDLENDLLNRLGAVAIGDVDVDPRKPLGQEAGVPIEVGLLGESLDLVDRKSLKPALDNRDLSL